MALISRRDFAVAAGGVVALGSFLAGFLAAGNRRRLLRPGTGEAENARSFADGAAYADQDGWLLTVEDKRWLTLRQVVYAEGWYAQEQNQEGSWRWSQPTATLSVSNPRDEAFLHLDYNGRAVLFPDRPRTVTLTSVGRLLHSFVDDVPGRQQRRIRLPAGVFGATARPQIQIALDRPFVPADHVESHDPRELGIQVFDARIELP